MSATVGNLATVLSVNSLGLTTGLGSAGKAFSGFGAGIGGIAKSILPVGAAIGGLIGTIKGVLSVADQFAEIDSIAKFSQATGIATEELVGLQHAAELSGVSSERLRDAQNRLLRQGLDIAGLADQMAGLSDPTERAQLAYKKLGRSGQELIPLLMQGGDAIRAMVAEGADLAGFSAVDAKKVEEANDAITRMKLAFTGVARDMAITFAPAVELVGTALVKVGQWGREAFAVIKDFAIDSFLVLEFGWQQMGEIGALAWDSAKLSAISFWEDTKFLFMTQIPAVVTWFADNFGDILFTALDYGLTLFINLGKNIRALWSGVLDFIAGKGFNVDFTPMTEGFVSAIDRLPEIPERALTETERQLAASIERTSGSLMDGLGQHLLARREELFGGEQFDLNIPDIGLGDDAQKALADIKGPGALQRGSSEAFSAVLAAMRGDQADPQARLLKTNEQQLTEQRKQTTALNKLVQQPPIEVLAGDV